MLTFLHTRSVAQDDYKEVSKDAFNNDIATFENMTVNQNLFIYGPGENVELPNGTVVTFNVTFTNITAKVFDAWKLTGVFGKTSYFERFFNSDKATAEKYSKNFVVSFLTDCITSFPVKVKSPIILEREPMPGYSTGQSSLYLYPIFYEFDLEIVASGYEPLRIHMTDKDEEVHLSPQIKNVNLSGNLNVNNQNNTNNSNNSLDIYSAKQIADILGLEEKDIIDLIKSKSLQGKIIGGKYYVRKVDLDTFMKK